MRRQTKGIATSALSDIEFENLFKPYRFKQLINWLVFIIGLGLIGLSIYAFIDEWLWGFPMVAPTILILIGLWFIARIKVKPNHLMNSSPYIPTKKSHREALIHITSETNELDFVRTRSMPTSRLVAGLIPLCIAFINSFVYGYGMGQNLLGTWFVLGGTSLFYPFSFILPMPIAILTLFYVLFSFKTVDISKSERLYQIEEYRFLGAFKTEIPRSKIQAIRITNSYMGPKYTWIFLLGLYIVWMYVDGFHFLLNPFAFGNAFHVGGMYVFSATVELVILITMVLKTPTVIQILTDSKIYWLQIFLPSGSADQTEKLNEIFGIKSNLENNDNQDEDLLVNIPEEKRFFSDYSNIITGSIFIIFAFVGRLTYFFTGFPFQVILYMFGFMLLVKGFKNDFSSKTRDDKRLKMQYNKESNDLFIKWRFSWLNSSYRFTNTKKEDMEITPKLAKLNFFDVSLSIIIPFFIGLTISGYLRFTPMSSPVWYIGIIYIIFGLFLLLLVLNLTINPQNSLHIKNDSINFILKLPGIVMNPTEEARSSTNYIKSLKIRYSSVFNNNRTGFLLRLLCIIIGISFGIISTFIL